MRIGAHLPLADFGGGCPTALELSRYVSAARDLCYATVAANDHLFWPKKCPSIQARARSRR
jgi:hypothetical protein